MSDHIARLILCSSTGKEVPGCHSIIHPCPDFDFPFVRNCSVDRSTAAPMSPSQLSNLAEAAGSTMLGP
ncbi:MULTISPECIES: hypothetical protein, partial [Bradyrhizobium]